MVEEAPKAVKRPSPAGKAAASHLPAPSAGAAGARKSPSSDAVAAQSAEPVAPPIMTASAPAAVPPAVKPAAPSAGKAPAAAAHAPAAAPSQPPTGAEAKRSVAQLKGSSQVVKCHIFSCSQWFMPPKFCMCLLHCRRFMLFFVVSTFVSF